MTEHYVTLFDSGFLPNGLALRASLERHAGDYRLWVLCIDERAHEALTTLALRDVTPISLAEAETPALLAVKPGRSRAEYCWTLTPFTPDLVFDRDPTARRATYVDADLWLASSPAPVFAELESASAESLITEHAYAPEHEYAAAYGTYCVQFMPFTREGSGAIRRWWQDRCLEWCFAEPSEGRFGDQKYLDDWPDRFGPAVRVLSERGMAQGPWNAARFPASEAVTYHFHRLRTVSDREAAVGMYAIPRDHVERLYRPYLRDLRDAHELLAAAGFPASPQAGRLTGLPALKDALSFRARHWRTPLAPRRLRF